MRRSGNDMITRARWEAGTKPSEMLRSALRWVKNPERKARLYRVALVRRVWDELPWISRVLTELAERQADGDFDESVLDRPLEYIAEGVIFCAENWRGNEGGEFPCGGMSDYSRYLERIGFAKPPGADRAESLDPARFHELARLAYGCHFECRARDLNAYHEFDSVPLIRDIFGNPFRPVAFSPEWRTDTAVSLARQMYESRDFSAMPILADAIQDAGCDCDEILSHCRDATQPHVRGCWVVDLVLNKS
jgi:hypothetical protein